MQHGALWQAKESPRPLCYGFRVSSQDAKLNSTFVILSPACNPVSLDLRGPGFHSPVRSQQTVISLYNFS